MFTRLKTPALSARSRFASLCVSLVALMAVAPNAALAADTSAEAKVVDAINEAQSDSRPMVRPIKDKWAVVIGVDTFKDSTIPRLKFSSKDARDFATFLVEKANFAPDHVLLLLNENATRHNIQAAVGDSWLPKRVLPDDLIVIYASSHGSPKEIDVGGDNFLIAYDTMQEELFTSGIKLQDLAPTIKQRTRCDRVVLILDACNSGAAETGGKGLFRSTNFDVNALAGRGQIVISSSEAEQRSWESKRYDNGVFTHNLIEILKAQSADKTDLTKTFDQLKDKVQEEVKYDRKAFQTPVMHSKWEGEPLKLTAKPVSPRMLTEDDSPYTYKKVIERRLVGEVIKTPTATTTSTISAPPTVPTQTAPVQTTPVQTAPTLQAIPPQIVVPPTPPAPIRTAPNGKEMDMWMRFQHRQ